jgi:hypothetical protein
MHPQSYSLTGFAQILAKDSALLWDIPGAGTPEFPFKSYIKDLGLRYFDGVILVVHQRLTENDKELSAALKGFGVPFFVVRTKVDRDIEDGLRDNEAPAETTIRDLRAELTEFGFESDDLFMVSSVNTTDPRLDLQKLIYALARGLNRNSPMAHCGSGFLGMF